jgi:hypothetical protein
MKVERLDLIEESEDDSTQQSTTTRLYELFAFPGVFHVIVFTADRLLSEKGFDADLVKNIEHYQGSWLTRWPGIGSKNLKTEEMRVNITSIPQFMVHVITSRDLSTSDSRDAMASRTMGFGKIYQDIEGGRLHERYGYAATRGESGIEGGGGIVVVRPDTHVAFRVLNVDSAAWADVDEYFMSILTGSS